MSININLRKAFELDQWVLYAQSVKLIRQMLQLQTLSRAIVHDLGFGFTS